MVSHRVGTNGRSGGGGRFGPLLFCRGTQRAGLFHVEGLTPTAPGAMNMLRDRDRSPDKCREGHQRDGEEDSHRSLLRIPKGSCFASLEALARERSGEVVPMTFVVRVSIRGVNLHRKVSHTGQSLTAAVGQFAEAQEKFETGGVGWRVGRDAAAAL